MKKDDLKNTLDKIKCSDDFNNRMHEQLSKTPDKSEYSDFVSGFDDAPVIKFRYKSVIAACMTLFLVGGAAFAAYKTSSLNDPLTSNNDSLESSESYSYENLTLEEQDANALNELMTFSSKLSIIADSSDIFSADIKIVVDENNVTKTYEGTVSADYGEGIKWLSLSTDNGDVNIVYLLNLVITEFSGELATVYSDNHNGFTYIDGETPTAYVISSSSYNNDVVLDYFSLYKLCETQLKNYPDLYNIESLSSNMLITDEKINDIPISKLFISAIPFYSSQMSSNSLSISIDEDHNIINYTDTSYIDNITNRVSFDITPNDNGFKDIPQKYYDYISSASYNEKFYKFENSTMQDSYYDNIPKFLDAAQKEAFAKSLFLIDAFNSNILLEDINVTDNTTTIDENEYVITDVEYSIFFDYLKTAFTEKLLSEDFFTQSNVIKESSGKLILSKKTKEKDSSFKKCTWETISNTDTEVKLKMVATYYNDLESENSSTYTKNFYFTLKYDGSNWLLDEFYGEV